MLCSLHSPSSSLAISSEDALSWMFILLYVCYALGAILFVSIVAYCIRFRKKQQEEGVTNEFPHQFNGLVHAAGSLEAHILVLSVKENGLDDLRSCRYFFQPEYAHAPTHLNALGVLLPLNNDVFSSDAPTYPVKGSLFVKVYRGTSSQANSSWQANKNKQLTVGLAGEGKRSYLQVNGDSIFSFVEEVEMPYNFEGQKVGSVTLTQPAHGYFGVCGYVRREPNGIRFVRTVDAGKSIENLINTMQSDNILGVNTNIIHQLVVPLADSGFSIATNHMLAWIPNRGIVDWPQTIPPPAMLVPQGLKGKVHLPASLEFQDVTDKMQKWLAPVADQGLGPDSTSNLILAELKIRSNNLQVGRRLSQSCADFSKVQEPRSIAELLVHELLPFFSAFAARKSEPMGRGVVFVQSSSDTAEWAKPFVEKALINRQCVVTYCSHKDLKRLLPTDAATANLDRDHILKTVGTDMNLKTHVAVLISLGNSQAYFFLLPLTPSLEQCKKCSAIPSKADTLLINWDLQITKFSILDLSPHVTKKLH